MVSYNVDLKKSVSLTSRVKDVVRYILDVHKQFDLICIQGIRDRYAAFEFAREFYAHDQSKYYDIYPSLVDYCDFIKQSSNISVSFNVSTEGDQQFIVYSNLIICRGIITDAHTETIIPSEPRVHFPSVQLVRAKVTFDNTTISVFSTDLIKDNNFFGTSCIRTEDLTIIDKIIDQWRKDNDLVLFIGSLNIPEILDGQTTIEYRELVNTFKYLDTYRIKYPTSAGIDSTDGFRYTYYLLALNDMDYFRIKGLVESNDAVSSTRIIDEIKQSFGFEIEKITVNDTVSVSSYYPVELMFNNLSNRKDKDNE